MGYRIIYEPERTKDPASIFWRRFLMITVFFCCFLQIVSCLWPEGEALLRSLWVFEGAQQLVDTVEAFAQELTGDPGKENAVRHFIDAVLGK